ncbi:myo-inositol-1-phosphate synthase [Bradyrhizobium sp. LM6.11]
MRMFRKPTSPKCSRRRARNVLVSYLPVGSQHASEFYAARAIEAGCGYVNCIPVFIASNTDWRRRFEDAGLPIVGDDIKSQVGATILHRVLANLFRDRGVRLDRTYQLNVGGNTDFKNMLERERLTSKKISKTQAVTSQFDVPMDIDNIHVGPSDHVPWLTDRKLAFIRLEGTTFGGVPLSAEVRLGGLGLPEFGRCRDRRGPLRQARHGPRAGRRADGPIELFHEVAAAAVHGR